MSGTGLNLAGLSRQSIVHADSCEIPDYIGRYMSKDVMLINRHQGSLQIPAFYLLK